MSPLLSLARAPAESAEWGGLGVQVPETLSAIVTVLLWHRHRNNDEFLLYEGMGRSGGLEVAGDLGWLFAAD